jgi:hypothetical protein
MTAQVKNRFKILSTYLGQDKAGQAMLKDLKDAVNVLRKKAAATTEAATDAEASRAAAVDRAKESDSALKESQQELRQVWGEVRRLTQLVEAKPVAIDMTPTPLSGTVKSVVKQLRRDLKYCPLNEGRMLFRGDSIEVFDRDKIAGGWSHAAIWRLGASTALLASMAGAVVIETTERVKDWKERDDDFAVGNQLLSWWKKNIDSKPDASTRLYEADGIQ